MLLIFLIGLACFLCIGALSYFQSESTSSDMVNASRSVSPWLVALAAASTNSSGFMFIGLIGATVSEGLSASWLMVGWIIGDYIAWVLFHQRVRERSFQSNAETVADFLSISQAQKYSSLDSITNSKKSQLSATTDCRTETQAEPQSDSEPSTQTHFFHRDRLLGIITSLVILVFLSIYAAAQISAGAKALNAVMEWPLWGGALLGIAIVTVYCSLGGIRGSIWTNSLQAIIMLATIVILLIAALVEIGGLAPLWTNLKAIDPHLVAWFPANLQFGMALYFIGWVAAGIGVVGQPHLIQIAMTIDDSRHIRKARRIYFIWYIVFAAACIMVGLCCRVLLDTTTLHDNEFALPRLASLLLPEAMVGVILTGLFAATLSTADTQILCCSFAISHQLIPWLSKTAARHRITTIAVCVIVFFISTGAKQSVFELVVLSWSALAASLGPLMIVRAMNWKCGRWTAMGMIGVGLAVVIIWRYQLQLSGSLYETLPGMLASFLIYGISKIGSLQSRITTTI